MNAGSLDMDPQALRGTVSSCAGTEGLDGVPWKYRAFGAVITGTGISDSVNSRIRFSSLAPILHVSASIVRQVLLGSFSETFWTRQIFQP